MKMKSLGVMNQPQLTVESFDGATGKVTLLLSDGAKKLRVEMYVSCVRKMVDVAREVVSRQRSHAMTEWTRYKHLKDYTGYTAPDGQE